MKENTILETIAHITIDKRFCGPPGSGNGGYVCGRLAQYIDGCVKVRLANPPPLDVSLDVVETEDGVALCHRDRQIARAWPSQFNLAIPEAPSMAEARAMAGRYSGLANHAFPGCFVCGPERTEGDGLRVFPGLSESGRLVGSPWTPDSSLGDQAGLVYPWFTWSALDCPSGWAFLESGDCAAVLGEFCVRIEGAIEVGQPLIVVGWELQRSGRKHHTASALFHEDSRLLACATALWFEIDPAKLSAATA